MSIAYPQYHWLLGSDKASGSVEEAVPVATPTGGGNNFAQIALAILIGFLVAREWVDRNIDPSPDDDTVIVDELGDYVLFVIDDDKQDALTKGQASAINWSGIKSLADSQDFSFRRVDVKSDLSKMEQVWQTMRNKSPNPPAMVVIDDGKLTAGPVPDGIEALKQVVESIQ